MSNLKLTFSKFAYVYGVKLRARGSQCRELEEPRKSSIAAKTVYDASREDCFKVWFDKREYGSWCKYSYLTWRKQKNMVKTTEHKAYGQLNGFFRLNIRDPCLSGVMLASITGRRFYNTSTRKRLTPPCQASLDIVPLINSFDSNYVFISTADIYPTEIAVLPLAQIKEEWLPIKLPIKDIQQNQWYAGDKKN